MFTARATPGTEMPAAAIATAIFLRQFVTLISRISALVDKNLANFQLF
jgi:hypothetical protein